MLQVYRDEPDEDVNEEGGEGGQYRDALTIILKSNKTWNSFFKQREIRKDICF